jgi:hypothetical protein
LACPFSITAGGGRLSYLPIENKDYTDNRRNETFITRAHEDFIDNPDITDGFKRLVCRCMAHYGEDQLLLSEVVKSCELVTSKTAEQLFPNGVPATETDEYIAQIVQEIVFNAPPSTL